MGKYVRRATTRHEVAVMGSWAGVRTRARTLAVQAQRLDVLELRSRCLEKPPQLHKHQHHQEENLRGSNRRTTALEQGLGSRANENSPAACISENCGLESGPHAGKTNNDGACVDRESGGLGNWNSVDEGSCGENNFEALDRSTRKSTPCSLIKSPDNITTPGSSTKRRSPAAALNHRNRNAFLRNIPSPHEMEEFFSNYEQQEQREFISKYNFDIVNDLPLPGRFQWANAFL